MNLNETVVFDPKRRRVETELPGENSGEDIGHDNMQDDGSKIGNGPKKT